MKENEKAIVFVFPLNMVDTKYTLYVESLTEHNHWEITSCVSVRSSMRNVGNMFDSYFNHELQQTQKTKQNKIELVFQPIKLYLSADIHLQIHEDHLLHYDRDKGTLLFKNLKSVSRYFLPNLGRLAAAQWKPF